jgi:hypothetical protein
LFVIRKQRPYFEARAAGPYHAITLNPPVLDQGERLPMIGPEPAAQKATALSRKECPIVIYDRLFIAEADLNQPRVFKGCKMESAAETNVSVSENES